MSKQKPLIPTGFDPRLLARMTGMLGDNQTLERLCGDLGLALAELLPGAFHNETGLDITFAYAGFDAGLKNDLIHDFGDGVVLTDGSLKNWCDDLSISCDSPVIITLMETLLGAVAQSIEEPEPRNLSAIELDIAAMVFEKIGGIVVPGRLLLMLGVESLRQRSVRTARNLGSVTDVTDAFACVIVPLLQRLRL